jgi:hypothetical protein
MKEKEVAVATVLRRPSGSLQVIIPKKDVATPLGLKGGEKVRVFLERRRNRFTYEVIR